MIILHYSACRHASGGHSCFEMQCTRTEQVLQLGKVEWKDLFCASHKLYLSSYIAVKWLSCSQQHNGTVVTCPLLIYRLPSLQPGYSLTCSDIPNYSCWGIEHYTAYKEHMHWLFPAYSPVCQESLKSRFPIYLKSLPSGCYLTTFFFPSFSSLRKLFKMSHLGHFPVEYYWMHASLFNYDEPCMFSFRVAFSNHF